MKYHINRSSNLCDYLKKYGWSDSKCDGECSDFSLWDTHHDKPVESKICVWNKKETNTIDCLLTFHKYLEKLKLTKLAPYTIIDWRNPNKRLTKDDFSFKDIWIMKHVTGVHGKGINILSSYDEYLKWLNDKKYIENNFVLQKCIYNSHLLKGRKYILRVYILTINDKCYLYHDCLYYTALFPLDKDYQDIYIDDNNKIISKGGKLIPKKQVRINTHISHWKESTELKPYGIKDKRIKGILSDLPEYKTILKNIYKNVSKLSLLFKSVYDRNHKGDIIYHIWGCDYIVLPNLDVKCIEVNAYPCLTHGDRGPNQESREFEYKFRESGFDRDLMRRLGFDLENKGNSFNSWIDVNKIIKEKKKNNHTKKKKNNHTKKKKNNHTMRK
tara:strand:+ start:1866 stop:3020 length:1155 start_codon:yes stop_codon:yes gene_type:complete